jgi:hypothetical protein
MTDDVNNFAQYVKLSEEIKNDLNPKESCHICGACTIKWCGRCKRPFCVDHQAGDNYLICIACVDNQISGLDHEPLVDSEGHTIREGKHITLVGEYWIRNSILINQLTDEELRIQIKGLKEAVKGTEMMLDNLRINLRQRENNIEEKQARIKRATLSEGQSRLDMIKQRSKNRVDLNQNPKDKIEALKEFIVAMKKKGLSKDQIMDMLQRMAARR